MADERERERERERKSERQRGRQKKERQKKERERNMLPYLIFLFFMDITLEYVVAEGDMSRSLT